MDLRQTWLIMCGIATTAACAAGDGAEPDSIVQASSTTTIPYGACSAPDCQIRSGAALGHILDETQRQLCVLAGIGADDIANGMRVALAVDASSGTARWSLTGNAIAACVGWSNFQRAWSNDMVIWGPTDPIFVNTRHAGPVDLWWGDAASALSSLHGYTGVDGMGAWIEQSMDPTASSGVAVFPWATGIETEASAMSVFVGNPDAHRLVKLAPCNVSRHCGVADGTEFHVSADHATDQVRMTTTDEAICYLTKAYADQWTLGEYLAITPRNDADGRQYWVLAARSRTAPVIGSARCMYYDQR
jgi:hypothetical protein